MDGPPPGLAMQRGIFNPKKYDLDDAHFQRIRDTKKFLAPKHELELEKVLNHITPRNHMKARRLDHMFKRRRKDLRVKLNKLRTQVTRDAAKEEDVQAQIQAFAI